MATVLTRSRTYPVEVERAFDVLLGAPLPRIFPRRHGPIPPVRTVDQPATSAWGEPGQQRVIGLGDGSTMRETLTAASRPSSFEYVLDGFTGRMSHLFRRIDGRWTFDPVGTGVRITWTWRVTAASMTARPAMPVFARLWQSYARNALDEIESLLLDA